MVRTVTKPNRNIVKTATKPIPLVQLIMTIYFPA